MLRSASRGTKTAQSGTKRLPAERESKIHPFHPTNGQGAGGPVNAPHPAPHPLAAMHHAFGNQAVLRSLSSRRRPTIQNKLTINTPSDQYEQEADRMAEQVMRMRDPSSVVAPALASAGLVVQRKCACEGTGGNDHCEECARKETLQRLPVGPATTPEAPPIVHDALRQPGAPLDPITRSFFEPRFGYDFGHVRVHADAQAAASAKAVNALAYTAAGSQIVFGPGAYAPETIRGRNLIAHELAHVIQQSKHVGFELQRQNEEPGEQGSDEKGPDDTHLTLKYEFVHRMLCGDFGQGDFCASKEDIMDWIKKHPDWYPGGGQIPDKPAKDCWPKERWHPLLGFCCPDNTIFDRTLIKCVTLRPRPGPNPAPCRQGWSDPLGTGRCFPDLPCPVGSWNPLGLGCSPVSSPSLRTPTLGAEILFKVDHPAEHEQDFDGVLYQGGRTEFDRLLKSLKDDPAMKVQLVGGASIEGPGSTPEEKAQYNQKLGGRRAQMVRAELVKNGISRNRIADPPVQDLHPECERRESGVFTCGSAWAKNPPAQSDREVMARVFKP